MCARADTVDLLLSSAWIDPAVPDVCRVQLPQQDRWELERAPLRLPQYKRMQDDVGVSLLVQMPKGPAHCCGSWPRHAIGVCHMQQNMDLVLSTHSSTNIQSLAIAALHAPQHAERLT